MSFRFHLQWPGRVAAPFVMLLTACATTPIPVQEDPGPPPSDASYRTVRVDESAMLPLLGYLQLIQRMTPHELARERSMLTALPPTPAMQIRLAMVLGQPRGPVDLTRALSLLDSVLKSTDPVATSVNPLARTLSVQYGERLRLELQNDKLAQQLKDSQRRSGELQEKLDALADVERSLTVRPAGERAPGALR